MVFVDVLRQTNPTARILVRVRRVGEIEELERLGADEAIPSEFETSIELFVRLLTHLGVPRHVVRVQESLIRLDHYHALRGTAPTPELLAETRKIVMGGILETAQVMKGSRAVGRTLAELDLRRRTGATVQRCNGAERRAERAAAADAGRPDAARGGGPRRALRAARGDRPGAGGAGAGGEVTSALTARAAA